ncbi:MAG: enoyl-CoA hydratase/isomerase family protein [Pseudomonadota bacterium]
MHDQPELLVERQDGLVRVTLNRPRALNALTWNMIRRLAAGLRAWGPDPSVRAVVVTAAGERAFSAGGDLRSLYESWLRMRRGGADEGTTSTFFRDEYRLNRRIFRFAKPYVSLIDGIVMGGGVGVSFNGRYRVVSERAVFAMPETGIGLFPDVGASHFLSRCPGAIGLYLGLTGARLMAADLIYTGLATHYVPASGLPALVAALGLRGPVEAVLAAAAQDPGPPPLAAQRPAIERCFAGETLEAVMATLAAEGSDWARATAASMAEKSPLSLKVTHRQLRLGAKLEFEGCMGMEYRLVRRFMAAPDFFEGVRALIIDKDNRPNWTPARLEEVSEAMVDEYFAPLDEPELDFTD